MKVLEQRGVGIFDGNSNFLPVHFIVIGVVCIDEQFFRIVDCHRQCRFIREEALSTRRRATELPSGTTAAADGSWIQMTHVMSRDITSAFRQVPADIDAGDHSDEH